MDRSDSAAGDGRYDADAIAVLDEGRIVGIGSHGTLPETNDLYRKLYRQQFGAVA